MTIQLRPYQAKLITDIRLQYQLDRVGGRAYMVRRIGPAERATGGER